VHLIEKIICGYLEDGNVVGALTITIYGYTLQIRWNLDSVSVTTQTNPKILQETRMLIHQESMMWFLVLFLLVTGSSICTRDNSTIENLC
jgi:hypothetical protein